MAEMTMHPGAQIRRRREILGLTRAEVAKRAGVNITSLQYFETGQRTPWPRTLARIEAALVQAEQARSQPHRPGSGAFSVLVDPNNVIRVLTTSRAQQERVLQALREMGGEIL